MIATPFINKHDKQQVINERDILGTQLIRRNDELALLYEKIKIQQSTMNKGMYYMPALYGRPKECYSCIIM